MNNSFESLFKKPINHKYLNPQNLTNVNSHFKKQQKINNTTKNKSLFNQNNPKFQNQFYNSSINSIYSTQKIFEKAKSSSKSNRKNRRQQSSKRLNSSTSKSKSNNFLKKTALVQLSKRQMEIRQAIEYRFQKSKMKSYNLGTFENKLNYQQNQKVKDLLDLEEQKKFYQKFGFLNDFSVINLYDYHRYKAETMVIKQKEPSKIIVIKNNKKKRQNSEILMPLNANHFQDGSFNFQKNLEFVQKNKLAPELRQYKNNNFVNQSQNFNSQRLHTEVSSSSNRNNEILSKKFKIQTGLSKGIQKQKCINRSKTKKQYSLGLNEKVNVSTSVQKNFKSIKDIYLNAINSLANKNTLKSKNKLFKSQNQLKNKVSKDQFFQIDKKNNNKMQGSSQNERFYQNKHQKYNSNREQKGNNFESQARIQNYYTCISSRQNKKQGKNDSIIKEQKPFREKLDKTLMINQSNPSQWKSIVMKIGDSYKKNEKQENEQMKDNKQFKIQLKQQKGGIKNNKSFLQSATTVSKMIGQHPRSCRQNTKSPKFKRYLVQDEGESMNQKKRIDRKNVASLKNLNNQSYFSLVNQSQISQNKKLKK